MKRQPKFTGAIGIDLGTTRSCVGVFYNDQCTIMKNQIDNKATPSLVAFTEDEIIVGEEAKFGLAENPRNVIYDTKRMIGRKYNDEIIQNDKKTWPFKVVEGTNNQPLIEIQLGNQPKLYLPEEISGIILEKMKSVAEENLMATVTDAVITVPAYFDNSQRQATKEAAKCAGLNVLRIINEPTAAALAYAYKTQPQGEKHILVFDLGGGTFDASILLVNGSHFRVLATAGNSHLGGQDFDNNLINYITSIFQKKYNFDPRKSQRLLHFLKDACEKAKINLSQMFRTTVNCLDNNNNYITEPIDRDKFNELNKNLFDSTLLTVKKVLKDAHLKKSKIDNVVLVGGSSRIPYIKEMLNDYFGSMKICCDIDPEEAIAFGASLIAAVLKKDPSPSIQNFTLEDVNPYPLGVEATGRKMIVFIPKNTVLPTTAFRYFSTSKDYQKEASIKVYEGESEKVFNNKLLGVFYLNNIPPAPRVNQKIKIYFDVDEDGIMHVSAQDLTSGNVKGITISLNSSLNEQKKDKKEEDMFNNNREFNRKISAKETFQNYCNYSRKAMEKGKANGTISSEEEEKVSDVLFEAEKYLTDPNLFKTYSYQIENMFNEVKEEIGDLVEKARQSTSGDIQTKKEEVIPKKEEVIIPKKEVIIPKKEEVIITKKEVIPKKEEVIITKKEEVIPKKEVIIPKKEEVIPKKEVIIPKKEVIIPKKEEVIPKKEEVIPKKEIKNNNIEKPIGRIKINENYRAFLENRFSQKIEPNQIRPPPTTSTTSNATANADKPIIPSTYQGIPDTRKRRARTTRRRPEGLRDI
ncbi:cytoplasmic heat shock protein 70 [Histomonas meleagridis]|uniref:cytoplasmic heat shock protein 70 n=1 Tax=Histomonas meleagridis TaxID=135588 RepID=UPI003559E0CB|nr:cytoplasmic heat shock protein 70 [Histomonas meleagridis]KAH0803259.1 cytoplasmic heat shock protein 70 [Histomonas meleagridis]